MQILGVSAHGSGTGGVFADIVVILATAGVAALVMARLRMATVPAYLIAGVIIGPGVLGLVKSLEQVTAVSELAVVLLMFGIGMHMDLHVLARGLGRVLLATIGSAAVVTLALWPAGMMIGMSAPSALAAAMALSMSSTAVVLRVLQQRREMGSMTGRIALAMLVVQDLLAIAVLLLLPPLARWQGSGGEGLIEAIDAGAAHAEEMASLKVTLLDGALAVVGVAAIVMVGRLLLPRLLAEAARSKSGSEVLPVLSLAAAMGTAALTTYLGLNAALGAFLAGFLLAGTPFKHHLGGQVGVIRDVFGAIFFTAIGMKVMPGVLASEFLVIVGGAVLVLAVKSVVMGLATWAVGATGHVALRTGLTLGQAGEFSIVLISAAAASEMGLLSHDEVGVLISIVVLTLMVTPMMIQWSAVLSRRLPRLGVVAPWNRSSRSLVDASEAPLVAATANAEGGESDAQAPPTTAAPARKHAIIAGYGLVGRAVADELKKMGVRTTIVEMNPSTVTRQAKLGRSIVFGDVSSPEVLETAGIHDADALILTIPDSESVMRACQIARQMHPEIFIVARTNFVSQGIAAAGLGANGVVVEEMATAKEMERVVKVALGGG